MVSRGIDLLPLSSLRGLESLARHITVAFGEDVSVVSSSIERERSWDASRRQHHAGVLLAQLEASRPGRVLGIASFDLFLPIFTHIFGLARLGGRAAVVSSYRLVDAPGERPAAEEDVTERLMKECVHEIGHTWGLVHCPDETCAMASSRSVEEVDLKGALLCARCALRLGELRDGLRG